MDDGQSRWQLESQERCRVILDDIGLLCIGISNLDCFINTGSSAAFDSPHRIACTNPQEGAQAPKQTLVGVSLSPGWEPTVIIDGVAIPDNQLSAGTRQLGEFFFSPGEDMVMPQLRRGLICAKVIAIPIIDIEVDNINHEWCWTSF